MKEETRAQVMEICKALDNKKASDIMAIYVADKTIIAEWFVICSGRNANQARVLCDTLEDRAEKIGLEIRRKEGYADARWIVLDFADILVHIFQPDERQYYNMERLWADDPKRCIVYGGEE